LFGDVASCARRTFAVQVDGITIWYGRRTVVSAALVQAIAQRLRTTQRDRAFCPCRRATAKVTALQRLTQ
jgi:hypothetical protein